MKQKLLLLVLLTSSFFVSIEAQTWKPANSPLMTKWSKDVSPDKVLPEYPRPILTRKAWQNLNGLWDYALLPKMTEEKPSDYQGKILVPFAIESALSGVMKSMMPKEQLWYHRTFSIPETWKGQRIYLHFGAIDWESKVYINGKFVGSHRGGFDAFKLDITNALKEGQDQDIIVSVLDPTDASWQLRGKQNLKPGGCDYTACSGIWQTVWLEPVPDSYVENLKVVTDINQGILHLTINGCITPTPVNVEVNVLNNGKSVASANGILGSELTASIKRGLVGNFYKPTHTWTTTDIDIKIPDAKLWSPNQPFLYDLKVTLKDNDGRIIDEVGSYFGMREIKLGADENGHARAYLNGKVLTLAGALDQGYWPDGVFTAPTDKALRFDIEAAKNLGLNAVRKHVKTESDRWYYWADKLGLIVFQDMPGGRQGFPKTDLPVNPEASAQSEMEFKLLIEQFYNHPSILCWILFNEGWGNHHTLYYAKWAKELDPTRLIDETSGFPWHGGGDVRDSHGGSPVNDGKAITIISENGGYGVAVEGHNWNFNKMWTYVTRNPRNGKDTVGQARNLNLGFPLPLLNKESKDWMNRKVMSMYDRFYKTEVPKGLTGNFFCQLVDVETECNGFLTYDRAIYKVDPDLVRPVINGSSQSNPTP